MTYELAKKLKDAGFPLRDNFPSYALAILPSIQIEEKTYLIPTLSDLIEACGNKQIVIWRFKRKWYAGIYKYGSDIYIDDYPSHCVEGETSKEAVANLWLELNRKT